MSLGRIFNTTKFLRIKHSAGIADALPRNIKFFLSTVNDIPVLRLFSKAEGCSLCDNAKEELTKFQHMFLLEEIDITAAGNETWFELYKYDIPVIHVNNREILRHYVDEKILLEALDVASGRKD